MESKLEQAERHVQHGRKILAEQERLIEAIKRQGGDTTSAENLLSEFKRSQELFEADLRILQRKGGSGSDA
jgi:DNA repair protein RadC